MQEQFHQLAAKVAAWFGEKTQWGVNDKLPTEEAISNFFDQYPLSSLLPYEGYDNDNQIYINRKSIGFVLEASMLTGSNEETENILTSIITDILPATAYLQVLLWASDKIGPILDNFEQARSGKGEIFEWLSKKRTDFLKRGTLSSLSNAGPLLLRDYRLFIIVSLPKKAVAEQIQALCELRNDIQSSLKSVNIASYHLPITQFMSFMQDIINPNSSPYPAKPEWNELDALNIQLTNPEYRLRAFPQKLLFDNEEESWDVRCFSVRGFPKKMYQGAMSENIGQMFNSVRQMSCPFLLSLILKVDDHEKAVANAQLKYINKDATAKSPMAKFTPGITKEHQDWVYVRQRLSDGDKQVKVLYQVVTYAKPDNANSCERYLRDLYQANGWKLCKESYLQIQSWLSMMPMMAAEGMFQDLKIFGRLRTMTAFNAATIMPLQGEWKGMRRASLLLPGRRGQLAVYNPFDNTEGNYNVAIAAKSGSGKSVFAQEYILSLIGSGGRVWVIDVGRSYQKTCEILNGEFIEFKPEKPISINPFTFIQNFDDSLELLKPLLSIMARPSSQASDEEVTYLEKALKNAWNRKGNQASITTVASWLNEQIDPICKNLAHLLYPYTQDGMYARFFEEPCTINLENPFVVLELEELKAKKDLQQITLFVLMYQISERMYLGSRKQMKSCVIDEAWDLLGGDNKGAAQFIETGYRRARRYNANFVTITQSINDYFKNTVSIAAYENSDSNIILSQKAESIDQIKQSKRLDMDPYTEKVYKSLKKTDEYSEMVIKGPSGLSIHRLILDPYSRILYSSKGDEFEAVKDLKEKGVPLPEAIEMTAQKFNYVT